MITSIKLTNFKCFRSLNLDVSKLNVFAGMNGAGKSTIIQSLLAVRQSWETGAIRRGRISLSGPLVDIGRAGEVYCASPNSDFVEISLSNAQETSSLRLRCRQSEEAADDFFFRLDDEERVSGEQLMGSSLFSEPFNFLCAERIGPRKIFQVAPDEGHPLRVGRNGENAPFIVASELREAHVGNQALILESSDEREYPTIQYQWALWMARLFPGFDVESQIYRRADQVRLGMALQCQETGQPLFVRPTNTGFGLSFVLGVIVAGLVAREGTILLVENPEAHLHPRAQSMVGEFLGRVASGGCQVFVETHSEHVLNGIRRMVRQELLTPNDVGFFFFSRAPKNLEPNVIQIPVSRSGDISNWPDGFFDQLDKDLSEILS